jgi:hypothetical protein
MIATTRPACFEIKVAPNNIGRFAVIYVNGERLYGNVLDLVAGTDTPKRIRIQSGNPALVGDVVQPHQYKFVGWADEEEE